MRALTISSGVQKCFFVLFSLCVLVSTLTLPKDTHAGFASRFSFSLGEEYNDNIFFLEKKTHDFITNLTPAFSLFYLPSPGNPPTFTASISSPGQIFARQSELNNFGDNFSFNTGYTYLYSPRLTFHLSDTLQRVGETRTGGSTAQATRQAPSLPTQFPTSGGTVSLPVSQGAADLVSRGDTITNFISARTQFLYAPNITLTGGYSAAYEAFLDQGGSDTTQSVGIRGVYKWRRQHNLHIGYRIRIINSRNGDDNVIHNFDIGDDYFSAFKIQLAPTLTLSASTGISLNTGGGGPRIVNNLNLTLIKIWRTAQVTSGVRRGLTGSLGVSGPSQTTSLFSNFSILLTRFLTGNAGVNYSLFDTDDVDFNTLQAHAGFQYWITNWLSSNLMYSHRLRDGGSGAAATDLRTGAKVQSNSIFLFLTATFDIWPNLGFAKGAALP